MIQITILQARELEMLLAPDINRQLVFREADWEKMEKKTSKRWSKYTLRHLLNCEVPWIL